MKFNEGDILKLVVETDFCGLPTGSHKGVVVNLKNGGWSVAFVDYELADRADNLGVVQFLNIDAIGNCAEITKIYEGKQGDSIECDC